MICEAICPSENPHVNVTAKGESTKVSGNPTVKMQSGAATATLVLEDGLVGSSTGDMLKLTTSGSDVIKAVVFQSLTATKKEVQLEVDPVAVKPYDAGTVVLVDGVLKKNANAVAFPDYAASTAYTAGDFIKHDGKYYKVTANVANTQAEWSDLDGSVALAVADDVAAKFATAVSLDGATVTRG